MASARAIATPLLLPAGETGGVFVDLVLEPNARRSSSRPWPVASDFDRPFTRIGASITFPSAGHVREQVEALEYHADLGAA